MGSTPVEGIRGRVSCVVEKRRLLVRAQETKLAPWRLSLSRCTHTHTHTHVRTHVRNYVRTYVTLNVGRTFRVNPSMTCNRRNGLECVRTHACNYVRIRTYVRNPTPPPRRNAPGIQKQSQVTLKINRQTSGQLRSCVRTYVRTYIRTHVRMSFCGKLDTELNSLMFQSISSNANINKQTGCNWSWYGRLLPHA